MQGTQHESPYDAFTRTANGLRATASNNHLTLANALLFNAMGELCKARAAAFSCGRVELVDEIGKAMIHADDSWRALCIIQEKEQGEGGQ